MTKYIENEYIDFEKYHKNKINIIVHILCGIIYMSCLNLICDFKLLPFYLLLLLLTYKDLKIIVLSIIFIYIFSVLLKKISINKLNLLIIFIISAFIIPEISHLYFNEIKVLNMKNINLNKLITNIIYFLPFSLSIYRKNILL